LANFFFEWKVEGKTKQPYLISLKDQEPFAIAGIWGTWGKEQLKSCCIITTTPNKVVEKIHNRMPVILSPEDEFTWLEDISSEKALTMLKAYPASKMDAYPVSTLVNVPANNSPEIIKRITL
jgi:putative SOS response-associated peptidase YedK